MALVKLTRASFNRIGYMHAIGIRGDTKSLLREWEKLYTDNYLLVVYWEAINVYLVISNVVQLSSRSTLKTNPDFGLIVD